MCTFLKKQPPAASPPQEGCDQTPALCLLPPRSRGFWEGENPESGGRSSLPSTAGTSGTRGPRALWEQEGGLFLGCSGRVGGRWPGPGCEGRSEQAVRLGYPCSPGSSSPLCGSLLPAPASTLPPPSLQPQRPQLRTSMTPTGPRLRGHRRDVTL